MSATTHDDISQMSFEKALAELERIVQQLESGEVELEQSIAIYERGAALRAHCEARLKDAELKVEKIVFGPDGKPGTEPADLDRQG
ncbi:exodeoxyribonuclease VII small subunit [Marinicauda algicola]|uniref:Exodeoxyribonuclease 7 small subunit n=1 Tax=Marinicauda algicola TaxID=2029849 RepID=A0A4V3RY01_9PROT|nr:exodeoxyribonuclease VII small subunit [Marinicauda algicola]TGY88489.1 exodeoxyribonuclease VII small subunit [Marinicauda algicola]